MHQNGHNRSRDGSSDSLLARLARHCRAVSVLVLAGVFRNRSFDVLERRVAMLPLSRQVTITGGVLGFLLALALVAAQFGPAGLALYFIAVVLLVR